MTAPVPEEREEHPLPTEEDPPGEHAGELPGEDAERPVDGAAAAEHERNAETSEDQPSQ
ncbi:hypothetical protein BKA08_001959 [Nocardioides marinisabuli]|uniref:Uncharacterized protein n=1 Tax=Nocardioides marinisabuli TaxID=419476 RepID=A0A7Y9F1N3_9ACTN|nr:hypothetical protein [Nocardioides marinisabuli]NYD57721.1 hypothetical protein [Nocardioides marinisabuli]